MRHFIFEFITGGGLTGLDLPDALVNEGKIMAQTLLNELSELENVSISITRDQRLDKYSSDIEQHFIEGNIEKELSAFITASDVAWLIAPETDGLLLKYAELFVKHGNLIIGSNPEAIKIAASKYLTNKILSESDINVIETQWLSAGIPESNSGWVVKPDDGVGGENTRFFKRKNDLIECINDEKYKKYIIQPYTEGKHMSMSLLVFNEEVQLLACNKQYIDIKDGVIKLVAIGVNEYLSFKNEMLELARNIVSAISGFAGYIGVDLIEAENELYVLEINPRFTTAYAGISESINCNVTSKILDTFLNKKMTDIQLDSAKPVRINV